MNEHVHTNEIIVGFLCGAVVGVGIALLTAPASGEVTRRRIGLTARKLAAGTRESLSGIRGRFGDWRRDLGDGVAHGVEEMDATHPCFVG